MADPTVHDRATLYIDAKRPGDAVALLGRHLATEPDDVKALCVLGRAQCETGDTEEAVANTRRAVSLAPENEWAWRVLALALASNGEHDDAREAARRAIGIAPDGWRTHLQFALVDLKSGKVDFETQVAAMRAVELAPGEAYTHHTLGTVALSLRAWTSAEQAFRRALAIDPQLEAARNNLAVVALRQGDTGSASAGFVDILAENPASMTARQNVLAAASNTVWRALLIVGIVMPLAALCELGWRWAPAAQRATSEIAALSVAILVTIVLGTGLVYLVQRFVAGTGTRLRSVVRAVRLFDPLQLWIASGLALTYLALVVAVASGSVVWIVVTLGVYAATVGVTVVRRRREEGAG